MPAFRHAALAIAILSQTSRCCTQVQGVNFRSGTIDEAEKLGVVGHVENTSNGTVTGEVQGEKQKVSQMKVSLQTERHACRLCFNFTEPKCLPLHLQDWLQNTGPPGAQIDKCNITNERSDLDKLSYSSFEKH